MNIIGLDHMHASEKYGNNDEIRIRMPGGNTLSKPECVILNKNNKITTRRMIKFSQSEWYCLFSLAPVLCKHGFRLFHEQCNFK